MNFWKRINSWLAAFSLNCRDASVAQSEALDHTLSPGKRLSLRLHLLICKWCRRYGRQIRLLREAACEHGEKLTEAGPHRLSAQARARIKQRLVEKN